MVDIISLLKEKGTITVNDVYLANPDVRGETIRRRIRDLVRIDFVSASNTKGNGMICRETILKLTDKEYDIRIRENKHNVKRRTVCQV
jgi:DeoR/GlpR family transcriptional regulator of sugar metabolism